MEHAEKITYFTGTFSDPEGGRRCAETQMEGILCGEPAAGLQAVFFDGAS